MKKITALMLSITVTIGVAALTPKVTNAQLLYPSCSSKTGVPLPSFASFLLSPTYNPDAPAEVEMKKDIFVTYPTR